MQEREYKRVRTGDDEAPEGITLNGELIIKGTAESIQYYWEDIMEQEMERE